VLAAYFLDRMAREFGQQRTLSDEAVKALLAYDWPGNVRELENSLQRACAMNSGPDIQVADLPNSITGKTSRVPTDGDGSTKIIPISELERNTILNTITQLNGDKLLAARLLGIGKTTLYRKLKEYEIQA
jgi:two-component system response regulator HydG